MRTRVEVAELLYRGIGRVVIQFQFVENTLGEILASLLNLKEPSDNHRVTASMSFGQKADLMCDLYDRRRHPQWPVVDLVATRKALYAAEQYRNRVVHSFWHIGGASEPQWIQTKASLRSKSGLRVLSGPADPEHLESGAQALYVVRDWYLGETAKLTEATHTLLRLSDSLSTAESENEA